MSDRPTIVLLPGNMCDERMWGGVMPAFSGWDTRSPVPTANSIHAMAQDCLSECSGPILPIGFSMGAIVALGMAAIAPARIAAMGLIGVNAGPDRPERASLRGRQQDQALGGNLADLVADELKPAYFAPANRSDGALQSLVKTMALDLGPQVFAAQSEALRTRRDYRPVSATLDVPVFLACGTDDELCPPQLHRDLAALIPRSDLHVVPGAGHMLPLEQPEALNRLLSQWLSRIEKEFPCQTVS